MVRYLFTIAIITLLSFQCTLAQSAEQESILNYQSVIKIQEDASIIVNETITVNAENNHIKHGIYRDFPTEYKDKYGNNVKIEFTVIDVLKDGDTERYFTQKQSNGVRIYIGKKDRVLSPGTYSYQIIYKATRELGFFKDYDELYWNVTGNGWIFPIQHVSATVELLPGSKILQYAAYTGPTGATGQDFKTEQSNSTITFNSTRALKPYEGLTIAVAWPKGFVQEPTQNEKIKYFASDNLNSIISALFFVLILIYYIIVWFIHGRDPRKGTIIPLFEAPDGLSPASITYIMNMGWGSKVYRAFTASLINMAVKKAIKIINENKTYSIEKINDKSKEFSPEEGVIFYNLLSRSKYFEFVTDNHNAIKNTLNDFKKTVVNLYKEKYFVSNVNYFIGGIILTIVFIFCMALTSNEPPITGFLLVWLSVWTFGVFTLLVQVVNSWKSFFMGSILALFSAIFITAFSLPFIIAEIFVGGLLIHSTSFLSIGFLIAILFVNSVFLNLLKQPTRAGRQLMDRIEGFKMFLETTEEERFKELYPPDITPEVFEKFLPYAIALNIENAWSKKCEAAIGKAEFEAYKPTWYVGTYGMIGAAALAHSIGDNLSSTISSSSSAPGSSSGSGGGGSSGGGGGGGGGGGW